MKRFLSLIVVGIGLVALGGVAGAQRGGGPGRGMGRGMGPGMMGGSTGCPGLETTTATQITEEKAKELAQQYADKYLAGFTVDKVLPFTGMRSEEHTSELQSQSNLV